MIVLALLKIPMHCLELAKRMVTVERLVYFDFDKYLGFAFHPKDVRAVVYEWTPTLNLVALADEPRPVLGEQTVVPFRHG